VGRDDARRKPLLEAARKSVEKDLGQPIRFVVVELRVRENWAFAHLRPQTPDGRPIDLTKTRYADPYEAGFLDGDDIYALLRAHGSTWKLTTFVLGPTDVAWAAWPEEYGAPAELLGVENTH